MSSFGVWLVGAAGNVGACTVAGWAAVRAGLLPPTGLVTFAPALEGVAFAPLDGVAFGGHDLGPRYLADAALGLVREGVLPAAVVEAPAVKAALAAAQSEVRAGTTGCGID